MELIPNVHHVPGVRGGNVYLLVGETLTLVDTGLADNADAILGYIEGLGRSAADVTRIVITHYHLDHVGGAAAVKQRTSSLLLAHPADAPFISGEQSPPPPHSATLRILFRLAAPILPRAKPVPVDVTLQDGDRLDILGGATVIHVPGHTPGSIALHFPSERLLICGDTIRHRGNRLEPPPKLFATDTEQAIASIRRMAELEFDLLCPGHGAPFAGGADKQLRIMVQQLG